MELGPSILDGLRQPLEDAVRSDGEDQRVKQCTVVEIVSGLVRGATCLSRDSRNNARWAESGDGRDDKDGSNGRDDSPVDPTWAMAIPLYQLIAESGSPDTIYDLADGIRFCTYDRNDEPTLYCALILHILNYF